LHQIHGIPMNHGIPSCIVCITLHAVCTTKWWFLLHYLWLGLCNIMTKQVFTVKKT
jgi:hypothetical protein